MIRGSCDLIGFAVYKNDGLGGTVFAEIDAQSVRDKPYYTEHTTTTANVAGRAYIFQIEAYNINGNTFSETAAFVVGDVPGTPNNAPTSDFTTSNTQRLKIDFA